MMIKASGHYLRLEKAKTRLCRITQKKNSMSHVKNPVLMLY